MTMPLKATFCLCLMAAILQSCTQTTPTVQDDTQQEVVNQTSTENIEYSFTSDAFNGIKKGEKIPVDLEKSVLETGEGDFDIYRIKDKEGNELAYIHPDFDDESLVGYFVTTSPKVSTPHGLNVGMTFGELLKKYPGAEVHGSEVEGYTSARIDDMVYALDFNHWSYDIDVSLIPAETKIKEITN